MIVVILKLDEIWNAQICVSGMEWHLGILFAKEEGIAARIDGKRYILNHY